MSNDLIKKDDDFSLIEQVVMQGDLSKLSPQQRVSYYNKVCQSAGLNPLTNPFAYILLNGKLTLYAKKDCTEQLRKINGVSIESLEERIIDDMFIVKAKARDKFGRTDESTGAVIIGHLKGEAKANAIMKAETKAKRRVTLSICGMGWVDESETDAIPGSSLVDVDLTTGEIQEQKNRSPKTEPLQTGIDITPKLNSEQVVELQMILDECSENYKNWFDDYISKQYNAKSLSELPDNIYQNVKASLTSAMESHHTKQKQSYIVTEKSNAEVV
jgi:hypothetical protein